MKKYRFEAQIKAAGGGAHVVFPYDVEAEFGCKGRVPVAVTFDGTEYKGSLIKYGEPQHLLPVLKAIRERIGKGPGDTVQVELWKDEETRTVEIPASFAAAMKKEGVAAVFDRLSYTHRREYCRWIAEAKKEETRAKRVDKAIVMLREGVRTPDGAKSVEAVRRAPSPAR